MSKRFDSDWGMAWSLADQGRSITVPVREIVQAWEQEIASSRFSMKSYDLIKSFHRYSGGTRLGLEAFFRWRKPNREEAKELTRYYRVMRSGEVGLTYVSWTCRHIAGVGTQTLAEAYKAAMNGQDYETPRLVAL